MSRKKAKVRFIQPPNIIKAKVGSGGLSDIVINRAQNVIEAHTQNFMPIAETYLGQMMEGIENSRTETDMAKLYDSILLPAVQLKANGAMFHYPLVTRIADTLVNFIETTRRMDPETIVIAQAFHKAMHVVVASEMRESNDPKGLDLIQELENACLRYLEKHKNDLKEEEAKRKAEKEAAENAS